MKKIVFVADSTADLTVLAQKLSNHFEIIWLTYHKTVYLDLKKLNYKKVYFCNLTKKLKYSFIQKIIEKFFTLFKSHKINGFLEKIEFIDKKENPLLFISDTFDLLRFYQTNKIKMSVGHSVCYKKFFLEKKNLDYDYIFLPGFYHLNRIKKTFSLNRTKNLKVFGSPKLSPFLKNSISKQKFIKELKLKYNTNILFAPTHDAHDVTKKSKFFPSNFGNQLDKLEELIIFLDNIKANLIIKLHHYHVTQTFNKRFKKFKNVYIFKSGSFFNTKNSSVFLKNSDVIITDTSGVATSGIFLDKKMIFLEPTSKQWNWSEADIEKKLRPGYVCSSYQELKKSLKNSIIKKDFFKKDRKKFIKKVFYKPNKDANIEIALFIKSFS